MAICMDEPIFYIIVGICILFVFIFTKKFKETLSNIDFEKNLTKDDLVTEIRKLKDLIYNVTIQKQTCERNLSDSLSNSAPKRTYITDTVNFYQVGYVSTSDSIFPLFGRRLYRQRSDRWEYYVIEGSENKVRIPVKTQGDLELSDGDSVMINNRTFTVSIYPLQNVVYNPM
jgi:hypothetical protein